MPKLLGIIGALVICAGLDLLWQSRNEIQFWMAAYINVFPRHPSPPGKHQRRPVFPPKESVAKRRAPSAFSWGWDSHSSSVRS